MNSLDKQYQKLLDDIITNGLSNEDRNGPGNY